MARVARAQGWAAAALSRTSRIGAAVALLFLAVSCARTLEIVRPAVVTNPYGFTAEDLESARAALAEAESAIAALSSRLGPYGFREEDVAYAAAQRDSAAARRDRLIKMSRTDDFDSLGHFIPGPSEIESGILYWGAQKRDLESNAIPYWNREQGRADSSGNAAWSTFCTRLRTSLAKRGTWIDLLLADLAVDETGNAGLTVAQIYDRKLALQSETRAYYADLVETLQLGVALDLVSAADAESVLEPLESIPAGIDYWTRLGLETAEGPLLFFAAESAKADGSGNAEWSAFCSHMLASLRRRLDLAGAHVADLEIDRAVRTGSRREEPSATVTRKRDLQLLRRDYFSNLENVVREGMALGVLESTAGTDTRSGSVPIPAFASEDGS